MLWHAFVALLITFLSFRINWFLYMCVYATVASSLCVVSFAFDCYLDVFLVLFLGFVSTTYTKTKSHLVCSLAQKWDAIFSLFFALFVGCFIGRFSNGEHSTSHNLCDHLNDWNDCVLLEIALYRNWSKKKKHCDEEWEIKASQFPLWRCT